MTNFNLIKKILFLLVVPILFFFSAGLNQTVHACSCAEGTIRDGFERQNSVIFSGKVTNIKEQQYSYLVSFEINQAWKGLPNDVKSINTSTSLYGSECGYGFTEDESYLVLKNGKEKFDQIKAVIASKKPRKQKIKELNVILEGSVDGAKVLDRNSPK